MRPPLATALLPTVALADGSWVSGLGGQDYVALGVLAFLVIFVIPSLAGLSILENQADPAAAIAKKQQKLKDLEDKYSFLVGTRRRRRGADAPPAHAPTERKPASGASDGPTPPRRVAMDGRHERNSSVKHPHIQRTPTPRHSARIIIR